jgi:LytS/YehU family sensor histidine kinase
MNRSYIGRFDINKHLAGACHMALWAFLFLSPMTYWRGTGLNIMHYLMTCMTPLFQMIVFYLNYMVLAPKFFESGKHRYDVMINVVLLLVLGTILHFWMVYVNSIYVPANNVPLDTFGTLSYIARNSLNLAIFAGGATALAVARRWVTTDQKLKETEAARAQVELRNLRSQINPHFLLNTLNNIYALTAFDTARAQEAIMQLSRLLRHMLYDNQEVSVSIRDEIQFLENYVSLMKIRLADTVDVKFDVNYESADIKVAPLLFISLIENAFKHGISSTEPSYIHIKLNATHQQIEFQLTNSNHPKTSEDHSGHGIGLQQVQRRLDLSYPGQYKWEKSVSDDNKEYQSTIIIQL